MASKFQLNKINKILQMLLSEFSMNHFWWSSDFLLLLSFWSNQMVFCLRFNIKESIFNILPIKTYISHIFLRQMNFVSDITSWLISIQFSRIYSLELINWGIVEFWTLLKGGNRKKTSKHDCLGRTVCHS